MAGEKLLPGRRLDADRELVRAVNDLNRRALRLLNDFIEFKENILRKVREGRLFTVNYPLLIEHVLREANHYIRLLETGSRE